MKKHWVIALIVVIIVAGLWLLLSNKKTVIAPTDESAVTTQVPVSNTTTGTSQTTKKSVPPVRQTNIVAPEVTPAPAGQTVTVTYTGGSFSPNPITIKKGYTVMFVNKGDYQMWIASDPHPSHTNNPGFDEKGAVGKDGSYSFTFTKVGTWGYHNHLNHSQTGTVIVQP
jgi:plastocyanin